MRWLAELLIANAYSRTTTKERIDALLADRVMKTLFDFLQKFPFKNFLAIPLIYGLFYLMANIPSLHDSCVVLLTLAVKYYYDSSTSSTTKDSTIAKALDTAQQLPGNPALGKSTVENADTVNIDQTKK